MWSGLSLNQVGPRPSINIPYTRVVKCTFFHKRILSSWFYYSLLSTCAQISTTACLHTEQILTHYLMIDQFSATADCRHQRTLEASLGSAQWPTIVRVSDW